MRVPTEDIRSNFENHVIAAPLKGKGWLATTACCKPNVHRDLRVAIDGVRIETAETFAIDWAKITMAPWSTSMTACTMRSRPF